MLAEVFSSGMDGEVMDGSPQIELASGGMALEAAIAMGRQINPEVAAVGTAGLVYGTGTAKPRAVSATWGESQESQYLFHRHL
jgi:hypothetical protein